MASNQAETGAIASQAGASTGDLGTTAGDSATTSSTGTPGVAELAGPDGANSGENGASSDEKTPDLAAEKAKTAPKTKQSTKNVVDATKKLVDTVLDEAAKATPAVETTKIKMLRSHPAYAYAAGEEGELPTEKADFLIAGGFAQAAGEGASTQAGPNQAQLASAKSAYERFVAVADAETDGQAQEHSPAFTDLPRGMQCAFVAAVDPTYTHQLTE